MKSIILCGCVLLASVAFADMNAPKINGWEGTAYHDGWFTYNLSSEYAETHAVKLDGAGKFVLSPEFPLPIRKVVLKVHCSAVEPSRKLIVTPLVGGNEAAGASIVRSCGSVAKANKAEYVHFNWEESDGVTAVRICLSDSGTGNWGLYEVYVFYGGRSEEDNAKILELTNELPSPAGVAVVDFTEDSLTAAADLVPGAAKYRFALYRLEGLPEERKTETFQDWPDMADGWTIEKSDNVSVSNDPNYADDDGAALRIEKKSSSSAGDISVKITSPRMDAPIVACSLVCRIGAKDKSDRFAVYGRAAEFDDWEEIASDLTPTTKGVNKLFSFAVNPEKYFHWVRFELTGVAENFTVAGVDTLSVASGGDETRTLVATTEDLLAPTNRFAALERGRYAVRAQALAAGGTDLGNSQWSEESPVVDLNWADLEVAVPQDVGVSAAGAKLSISWSAAAGAECYLVDVFPVDDPESPIVVGQRVTGTKTTATVETVGEYGVRVTAVSPCAKSTATSLPSVVNVVLGKLGAVTVEATDPQTIVATWKGIPLAESYQARIFCLGGSSETMVPDFSGLPDRWPEGWNHYAYDETCYSGPVPKMMYARSWIETCEYDKPVTVVTYKFKSHVTAEEFRNEIGKTSVVLAIPGNVEGQWVAFASHVVTETMQTFAEAVPADKDVRKLRFFIQYAGDNPNYESKVGLEFSVTSVVCGELTRMEVGSVSTTAESATFGGLASSERYQVEVLPQPSEDQANSSSSEVVDLASERFRRTGAVPLSQVKGGFYCEDFSSLSNVTSDAEAQRIGLDYWQFNKGAGATDKILYTAGTNRTTGGVYAFGDEGREWPPYRLGTLATSSLGCSVGIAFRNDRGASVGVRAISFDTIQRSFRTNPSGYAFEWRVTDGATGIADGDDWQSVPIAETAPWTAATQDGLQEFGQTVTVLPADLLSVKIPVGGVLVLRWRHEKVSSGPMMAIDNVKIEFERPEKGLSVSFR